MTHTHRYSKMFSHFAEKDLLPNWARCLSEDNNPTVALKLCREWLSICNICIVLFSFVVVVFSSTLVCFACVIVIVLISCEIEWADMNFDWSTFGGHFNGKWWARYVILAPHNQQRVFAPLTDIVIDVERIFSRVFHLHLFAWTFRIVQAHKQYAVTWKKMQNQKTHMHMHSLCLFSRISQQPNSLGAHLNQRRQQSIIIKHTCFGRIYWKWILLSYKCLFNAHSFDGDFRCIRIEYGQSWTIFIPFWVFGSCLHGNTCWFLATFIHQSFTYKRIEYTYFLFRMGNEQIKKYHVCNNKPVTFTLNGEPGVCVLLYFIVM